MADILSIDKLLSEERFDFLSVLEEFEDDYSPYDSINIDCKYYNEDEIINSLGGVNLNTLLSLNVQSLPSKFYEFCDFIHLLERSNIYFNVIAIQEVFQIPDPSLFNIRNYHEPVFKLRSSAKKGGGVGFYVHHSTRFKIIEELSIFEEQILETLFIEIELSENNKFIVGNFYRPPSNNLHDLEKSLDKIQEILTMLNSYNRKCILTGDFNLCLLNHATHPQTSLFIDTLFSAGFLQTITHPTRVANNAHQSSATLIDHIWTSDIKTSYKTGIITNYLSDHHAIFYIFNSSKSKVNIKEKKSRIFSEDTINSFLSEVQYLSFENVLSCNDTQNSYDNFHSTFFDLYNRHFPKVSRKVNKNTSCIEKWMTKGILASRRQKIKLGGIYSKHPSMTNKQNFTRFKNMYNRVIRSRKKMYFTEQLVLTQGNLKKAWEIFKDASGLKNKVRKVTERLIINDEVVEGDEKLSQAFCNHFCSIAEKIRNDIAPTDRPPDSYLTDSDNRFTLPLTSPQDIIEIVTHLKDKTSQDFTGLSSNILKKVITCIAIPLSHVFNLSIQSGVFPTQFKIAKVTPVFKKGGSETNVSDFRPISLLSIFSKILEKHVCNNLKSFMLENNVLDPLQFGFQNNNSTSHPMLKLLNKIGDAIQKKEYTIAVFCDLSKAFDLCPIELILLKLEKYGIRGAELEWFKSYLTNRKLFVECGDSKSSLQDVKFGVPQGSILGPILFLLFFNDLPKSTLLYTLLFCDDTTLLASGPNLQELINFVNEELQKVSQWFRSNMMSLHPNKTKFTIFHTTPNRVPWENVNIFIDENDPGIPNPLSNLRKPVTCVSPESDTPAIKFLGVYFDPGLTFKYHISQLNIKLSKSLFLLRRCKNLLGSKAMKALYYSTFHCHLIYGLLAYSSACQTDLKSIITKQKFAVRSIVGASYNAHTSPIYKELNIMPFDSLINYFSLQFMADFKYGRLPRSFQNTWSTRHELNQRYPIRNASNYHIPVNRTNLNERLPFSRLPNIWNNFNDPQGIKNISSKPLFKLKLKKMILSQIGTM